MPNQPATKKPPKAPPKKAPPSATTRTAKTFTTEAWTGQGEGEKIILYAELGMGKTTLASMAPDPIFFGLDDGGRKIKNPITGEDLQRVPNVESFQDVCDALQQPGLFDKYKTIVLDTATKFEEWAFPYMFQTIKHEKGYTVNSVEGYGYGKGYRHLYDTMLKPLSIFDPLVKQGKNILILCQSYPIMKTNPGGEDFTYDVPKLQDSHGKTPSIWGQWAEWADHVFKIGHTDIKSEDKKAKSDGQRAVFVHPEITFVAKSRTLPIDVPVIAFSEPSDNSIWEYMFDE